MSGKSVETRYTVRTARGADLEAILAVERASFGRWAWDRKLFAEILDTPGSLFLVVEAGDGVDGYCAATAGRGGGMSLDSIAVAPRARGTGAADALLRSLLRRARARGAGRMTLMVKVTNRRAQAFYERHGFRRTGRVPGYYEDGRDGFRYVRDAPASR